MLQQGQDKDYPDADIGSNHNLVLMNLWLKMKVKWLSNNPQICFVLDGA